jgi:hypothetical protein
MKILSHFFVFAVLLTCARPTVTSAQSVEIKQRWIAGKKYFQTVQTEQQSSFAVGPQKMEQAMKMTMEISLAVRPHEDGQRKRLTLRYDRVAVQMKMNAQEMSYDSAKSGEGTDPMGFGKTMGATVGKELIMLLNAKDEITEIENYEDFLKQLGSSPVPGMDPRQMYSREALSQMLKQGALLALPPQKVTPGTSWPFANEIILPQIGKIGVSGTYTFKGLAERGGASCAEIATDANLSMDLSGPAEPGAAPNAAAQLKMKVTDGTLKGTVWFDPALGQARDAQLMQEMTLSMQNPTDPSATITMPMKQNISTTLTKVEDLK